eukprot:TRINITY_DN50010_c0_g1_i1.p1 TRINITY_DN50010_c0_g1~~TRINITY_DN50010_c0_g1_i1.p1  ORF type:complete len:251 (+),score=44.63 TRINITY_DN50010_c0_g1_i1:44-796(+)
MLGLRIVSSVFFFQAEDGIRDAQESRGLGDVYKRQGSSRSTSDVPLGALGIVIGAALPLVCVGLAWGVVSRRCYRLVQVPEAVVGVWFVFLPSFELDGEAYPISKAFSTVVGRTRRPSSLWAGLYVIQPVVLMLVIFVEGASCEVFLIIAGTTTMMVGALCHVLFRPHRIVATNYLQGIAMALNAAMLFIASKLTRDPLNVAALDANSTIAMIQVCLLYTSDAADEEDSVDLGGRRIIKKKKSDKMSMKR